MFAWAAGMRTGIAAVAWPLMKDVHTGAAIMATCRAEAFALASMGAAACMVTGRAATGAIATETPSD